MTVPRERIDKAVISLRELLTPNTDGQIIFGAKNEPLKLSQVESLSAIQHGLEQNITLGHIVGPGGIGKTRIGIALAHALDKHKANSLFVVPTQQALEDFVAKAKELCPDLHVGAMYQEEKQIGRLTFITYASLLDRIKAHEEGISPKEGPPIDPKLFDAVIWDEAHMYLTANAQDTLQKFDHTINIGLTATPRYYTGKEVGLVFGPLLHEIPYDVAKDRKEVNDVENILVTTDVKTGLRLTTPDQEEGPEVSKAINRRKRNLIPADIYKNIEVTVERNGQERNYSIAGEPTVVFGAGIDHVHDIADAINAALAGPLKHDNDFREKLRAKGINPDDPDLIIAAPIHSGRTDNHEGMSLGARNRLVDKYHDRKVLMLVSTSVLQQSFDSPITSVVIDTVPRQTYVGVGQAGMRATRPGKDMAFVINMQDADHPSLAFDDYRNNRGVEEGVAVEIGKTNGMRNGKVAPAALATVDQPISNYSLTYGASLHRLVDQRRIKRDQLHRDDFEDSTKHFTTQGYDRINRLLIEISNGNKAAITPFIQAIQPWLTRTKKRLLAVAQKTESNWQIKRVKLDKFALSGNPETIDTESAAGSYDISGNDEVSNVNRTFGLSLPQKKGLTTIAELLKDEAEAVLKRGQHVDFGTARLTVIEKAAPLDEHALEGAINDSLAQAVQQAEEGALPTWSSFQRRLLLAIKSRFAKLLQNNENANEQPLSRAIQKKLAVIGNQEESLLKPLTQAIDDALNKLDTREQAILRLRIAGSTLEEIGKEYGVSKSHVGQIVSRSMNKLRHPQICRDLEGYISGGGYEDSEYKGLIPRERTLSEEEARRKNWHDLYKNEPNTLNTSPAQQPGVLRGIDDIVKLRRHPIAALQAAVKGYFTDKNGDPRPLTNLLDDAGVKSIGTRERLANLIVNGESHWGLSRSDVFSLAQALEVNGKNESEVQLFKFTIDALYDAVNEKSNPGHCR